MCLMIVDDTLLTLGGFAQDCVQQGHPELISSVLDSFDIVLSKYIAEWIVRQGGWVCV